MLKKVFIQKGNQSKCSPPLVLHVKNSFLTVFKNGKIYFNEINTIPGFTSISMYPRMWQASGLSYAALLDSLIGLAMMHHDCRQQLVRHYQ